VDAARLEAIERLESDRAESSTEMVELPRVRSRVAAPERDLENVRVLDLAVRVPPGVVVGEDLHAERRLPAVRDLPATGVEDGVGDRHLSEVAHCGPATSKGSYFVKLLSPWRGTMLEVGRRGLAGWKGALIGVAVGAGLGVPFGRRGTTLPGVPSSGLWCSGQLGSPGR
jgi:hypothetical protein